MKANYFRFLILLNILVRTPKCLPHLSRNAIESSGFSFHFQYTLIRKITVRFYDDGGEGGEGSSAARAYFKCNRIWMYLCCYFTFLFVSVLINYLRRKLLGGHEQRHCVRGMENEPDFCNILYTEGLRTNFYNLFQLQFSRKTIRQNDLSNHTALSFLKSLLFAIYVFLFSWLIYA
jgi:hypothetical protein